MSEEMSAKERLKQLARELDLQARAADPNRLHTMTMTEIYDTVYEAKPAVIDDLLYPGLSILVGDPKIGKSFLVLQFAYHVASGKDLWERHVRQGDVLYLALEDQYERLQRRLFRMFREKIRSVCTLRSIRSSRVTGLKISFGSLSKIITKPG